MAAQQLWQLCDIRRDAVRGIPRGRICRPYKITVLSTSYLYAEKISLEPTSMEWLLCDRNIS
jgi:hypothetical protein